jgi:hypothetical protein
MKKISKKTGERERERERNGRTLKKRDELTSGPICIEGVTAGKRC